MKIQYNTSAICKLNFIASGTHAECSVDAKKVVKLTVKPEVSDTCHICKIYFKIAVGDFGKKNKYISIENLFIIWTHVHLCIALHIERNQSACVI